MNRITPTHFIEVWKGYANHMSTICPYEWLDINLRSTRQLSNGMGKTIALFLIKPQSTTLEERMEVRGYNHSVNSKYFHKNI